MGVSVTIEGAVMSDDYNRGLWRGIRFAIVPAIILWILLFYACAQVFCEENAFIDRVLKVNTIAAPVVFTAGVFKTFPQVDIRMRVAGLEASSAIVNWTVLDYAKGRDRAWKRWALRSVIVFGNYWEWRTGVTALHQK